MPQGSLRGIKDPNREADLTSVTSDLGGLDSRLVLICFLVCEEVLGRRVDKKRSPMPPRGSFREKP